MIANEDNNNVPQNTYSNIPIAVLEVSDGDVRYVRSNRSYLDFANHFFGVDIADGQTAVNSADDGSIPVYLSVVNQCGKTGNSIFCDDKMPDGSVIHSFVRRVAVNVVTGCAAVAIAILSISEPDDRTTYADIAKSLAADYYNIYVVDLDSDTYIEYVSKAGGEELSMERHGMEFFESARRETITRIHEEDQEPFLRWFTKENVLKEIEAQGFFTATYRLIDTGMPVYVNMKITRMQGGNRLILGISNIDAQMKQQEEEKMLRQENLSWENCRTGWELYCPICR